MKFKVGDRVVVKYGDNVSELNGVIGTITLVEDDKIWADDWSDGEAGWFRPHILDYSQSHIQQEEAKKLLGLK